MIIFNFNDILQFFQDNPLYMYVCGGALALIIILIIICCAVKGSKKKGSKAITSDEKLVRETLKEVKKEEALKAKEQASKKEIKAEEPKEEVTTASKAPEEPAKETKAKNQPAKKAAPKKETKAEEPKEEVKAEEPKEEVTTASKAPEEPVKETKAKNQPSKKAAPKKETKPEAKEEPKQLETLKEESKPTPKEEKVEPAKKTRVVTGKYEVYFDGEKYFYILKASNGEKLIISELYASKDNVLKAIDAIKRNVEEGSLSVTSDKRGLYQFTLTAKNHRKLVMSANYPTEKGAISASESFKRFAGISPIVDMGQTESIKETIEIVAEAKKGGKIGVIEEAGKYYYILKASNGEVLINSDAYSSNDLAQNGLASFKDAIKNGKFFVEKDKRDFYQFKLYSQNGRLIVAGESYPTKTSAISAANSVCSFVELAQSLND